MPPEVPVGRISKGKPEEDWSLRGLCLDRTGSGECPEPARRERLR